MVAIKSLDDALPIVEIKKRLVEYVSVTTKGAIGDGVYDNYDAVRIATETGLPVYFPAGSYYMSKPVTYTGRVNWFGEGANSVIICDDYVLKVESGSNSTIDNITLMNKTVPTTLKRNPANWQNTPVVSQSNDGYQPTNNDKVADYPTLSDALIAQDIGPKIFFSGNATGIKITRIYGRFVSIMMLDTINSSVSLCDFKAGKNFVGGIMFWNINDQVGFNNSAFKNTIKDASFNGIVFARNIRGYAFDNTVSGCGESGIKTYQNTVAGKDARCYDMRFERNTIDDCFFDGIDGSSDYPHTGNITTRLVIENNIITRNCRTGIVLDGKQTRVTHNKIRDCSDVGILGNLVHDSNFDTNILEGNNLANSSAGVHELTVVGTNNTVRSNRVKRTVSNGYCIYCPGGNNKVRDNIYEGGEIFLGAYGSVTKASSGNLDTSGNIRSDTTYPVGFRQNSSTVPALQIFTEDSTTDVCDIEFFPRRGIVSSMSALIRAVLAIGSPGSELSFLQLFHVRKGVKKLGLSIFGDNEKNITWVSLQTPGTAPDGYNGGQNGNTTFWLDPTDKKLMIIGKFDDGTIKTGFIQLS